MGLIDTHKDIHTKTKLCEYRMNISNDNISKICYVVSFNRLWYRLHNFKLLIEL